MRQRLRPSTPSGLLEQLAVVGALALAAAAAVLGYGDDLAHDLRERLLWLTPLRALVAAIVLALGFAAWSDRLSCAPVRLGAAARALVCPLSRCLG